MPFVYMIAGLLIWFAEDITFLSFSLPYKGVYAALAIIYGIYRLILWNIRYKNET